MLHGDVTPMGQEMLLIPDGSCNDNAKTINEIRRKSDTNLPEPDSKKRWIPA
jgi:hypothetical protein